MEGLINETASTNEKVKIKNDLRNILLADSDEKNLEKLNRYMDILGIEIDGATWELTDPRYKATYKYAGPGKGGEVYVYIQTSYRSNSLVISKAVSDDKWIKKVEDALSLTPQKTTSNYIYYNVM